MNLLLLVAALSFAAKAPAPTYPVPVVAPSTAPLTVDVVVKNFEQLDLSLKTLSADFKQYVRWDESGTSQSVEGTLDFKKPDRLRLQHRIPEPQTITADGAYLWIWRESTNQVIKAKFEDWKKSEPMAQGLLDFGNYAGLLKSYDASISTQSAPDKDGYRDFALRLTPKQKGKDDFVLTLKLSTRDYFPRDTELKAGSVSVHSIFNNIRYNPPVPDERFKFTPPAGADVFESPKPKGK